MLFRPRRIGDDDVGVVERCALQPVDVVLFVVGAINPTPKLDTKTMRRLNAKVSIEGKNPKQVAKTFLKENGFI